jgi:hypothetical protein
MKYAAPPPSSTSGFWSRKNFTMAAFSSRLRVWDTTAAGVASSRSASLTMPMGFLVARRTSSPMVSCFGSSRGSGVRSAYTPMAFTLDLWPVM